MRIVHKITGVKSLMKKLQKLPAATIQPVKDELVASAMLVEGEAKKSMRAPKHGREYEKYSPRRSHQASKAGEPPAIDTGGFVNSIHHYASQKGMVIDVGTNDERGPWFEFGTKTMKKRPWLSPAFKKHRKGIVKRIATAVQKALRRFKKK